MLLSPFVAPQAPAPGSPLLWSRGLLPGDSVNRSFSLDAVALALLAAMALVLLVLVGLVRAEPLTTHLSEDSSGREVGRAVTSGGTTALYDNLGRETGRATPSGNGTTFYDNFGRETGRANRR